jgi:GT2 family glycosyltransferase
MKDAPVREYLVTIIVVPRERFSFTRESLESIYRHTQTPFRLVYVDGGSPRGVQRYLQLQAREKEFCLIRTDHYLSPNHARNLGLRQVNTKYVVFMDNDVIVTPGWLSEMIDCAEVTGATIVSPLICQGTPVHEIVHCAGGESGVRQETNGNKVKRHIIEEIYRQGQKLPNVRDQLRRQQTGLAEFHCMMVRSAIFEKVGPLDERLLNTKEHVDLCMAVAQAGGTVYLEPRSVVTYLFGSSLKLSDVPFYSLRWSDAWELASLQRLREKWHLTEDDYFEGKYKTLGWRRQMAITRPLSRRLALGRNSHILHRLLVRMEKMLNRRVTSRYARKHLQPADKRPGFVYQTR